MSLGDDSGYDSDMTANDIAFSKTPAGRQIRERLARNPSSSSSSSSRKRAKRQPTAEEEEHKKDEEEPIASSSSSSSSLLPFLQVEGPTGVHFLDVQELAALSGVNQQSAAHTQQARLDRKTWWVVIQAMRMDWVVIQAMQRGSYVVPGGVLTANGVLSQTRAQAYREAFLALATRAFQFNKESADAVTALQKVKTTADWRRVVETQMSMTEDEFYEEQYDEDNPILWIAKSVFDQESLSDDATDEDDKEAWESQFNELYKSFVGSKRRVEFTNLVKIRPPFGANLSTRVTDGDVSLVTEFNWNGFNRAGLGDGSYTTLFGTRAWRGDMTDLHSPLKWAYLYTTTDAFTAEFSDVYQFNKNDLSEKHKSDDWPFDTLVPTIQDLKKDIMSSKPTLAARFSLEDPSKNWQPLLDLRTRKFQQLRQSKDFKAGTISDHRFIAAARAALQAFVKEFHANGFGVYGKKGYPVLAKFVEQLARSMVDAAFVLSADDMLKLTFEASKEYRVGRRIVTADTTLRERAVYVTTGLRLR
jgi:hypothetical protein